VDTPTPFRVSDLLRFIDEAMGKLEKPDGSTPYLRLKMRLESLRDDRRFAFMFSEKLVNNQSSLSEIVGRLLRIPVAEKPLTVIDLSGVPSEVADVIVSLVCRLTFDFAVWSERARMPVLLVCEEAHRYVPADERLGFPGAARAITRIAREGRKYGIALGLVSQRPSELLPQALSQCGTIFALRLANEVDQRFLKTVLQDGARGHVPALSSFGTQDAVICGEAVQLPMRIRFDDLAPMCRPRSEGADFVKAWRNGSVDAHFRDEGVRRWRQQSRKRIPV
jgi:DNA helicase HerA-like ATPase